MKHEFTIQDGPVRRAVTLVKHPKYGKLLTAGKMTAEALAATPWYLRVKAANGRWPYHSLGTSDLKAAVKAARTELKEHAAGPDRYEQFRQAVELRSSLTIGRVAEAYAQAGYPSLRRRQMTPRKARNLVDETANLDRALKFWRGRSVTTITQGVIDEYADTRSGAPRRCELELVALSNACKFAMRKDMLPTNPFAGRGNIRTSIVHCASEMPLSDEELHQLCAHLMANPDTVSYGAQLMFQALTGLRPGEPGILRWDAKGEQPGARATCKIEGETFEIMHIVRLKRGINPAIRIRPALAEFLTYWQAYVANRWPGAVHLFPDPAHPDRPVAEFGNARKSHLDQHLKAAAAAIGITTNRRPHAMRAFYVRVRRSQGVLDSTIASELGERTGERVVVENYGESAGIRGDGRFDWLPEGVKPCWQGLTIAGNITPLAAAA